MPWNKQYKHDEPVFCPVCKTKLGQRKLDVIYRVHCEECKATFTWEPGSTLPNAMIDSTIRKPDICGCPSCKLRDGR